MLEMRGISKSYPGVQALRDVDLDLHAGEVLAVLGENGAGKSTLLKMLGGAHQPDAGTIRLDGRPVTIGSPVAARRAGIAVIYQEFNLVPALSARENIFLGRESTRLGFLRRGDERQQAAELFRRLGVTLDPEQPCRTLSVAQQQTVEIAKALSENARLLVLDEPSAALTPQEVDALLTILDDLRRRGLGVIYVSHRLDEIFRLADRILVLRDGQKVATVATRDVTRRQLIERMVGRALEQEFPRRPAPTRRGAPRLVVRDLRRGDRVRGVSFSVNRGEILALTGLVGSGRTETARLIFGADRRDGGTIELDGRRLNIRRPRDAIRAGICLLTEDRKRQGLLLGRSVLENFGLPNLRQLSRGGFVRRRAERDAFDGYAGLLHIKLTRAQQLASQLSGGNQQKVVLAKWLQSQSEVVIFDEPTRGIDVGARYELYVLMNELAQQGKSILMISSELPEVLGMADRILVMHEGRITGEIADVAAASQTQIMELAVGRSSAPARPASEE